MFRQAILPTIAAAMFAAITPLLSLQSKIDQTEVASPLDDQLFVMNRILDRLDAGSAADATLADSLASVRSDIDLINKAHVEDLSKMKAVLVALESKTSEYDEVFDAFAKKVEEKAEVDEELPAEGVATLNVKDMPSIIERPESFSDLVDIVLELKASVKALEGRSVSSSGSTVSYQAASGGVSNGSCGTSSAYAYSSPVVSTSYPSYSSVSYSTPTYSSGSTGSSAVSYSSAPVVRYSAPARRTVTSTTVRRGLFNRGVVVSSPVKTVSSAEDCYYVTGADGKQYQVCPGR